MQENDQVKKDIVDLLSQYFGSSVADSYFKGYSDETLPIYIHTAYGLLEKQIGRQKSKQEMNAILETYSLQLTKYE